MTSTYPTVSQPLEEEPAAGTSLRELAAAAPARERTLPGHLVHVSLEDGTEFEVRVDNRDFIRWDKTSGRHKWDASKQPFIFQTFLAWSAAQRLQLTALDFDAFLSVCLGAEDVKAGPEDEVRPTR